MQRYLLSLAVGTGMWLTGGLAQAQQCPVVDVRAALAQACPCAPVRTHGQYMKCVRDRLSELRQAGCDVGKAMHCAEMSTCGKPGSPAVCCNRNGRAQVMDAGKCTARGGKAMTAVSVCDVSCPAPSKP